MKQKDIVIIVVIIFFSGIFAFVISSQFLISPDNKKLKAEVVTPINSEFTLPDKKNFNVDAINPTKLIEIAPNDNNQPFANE